MDKVLNSYILFIYGFFNEHDEIEDFCLNTIGNSSIINEIRYIIEDKQNIIVIFETSTNVNVLSTEIKKILDTEKIKFYFIFEKDTIVTAHIPVLMKNFIFKPKKQEKFLLIDFEKNIENEIKLNLDDILEKIEKKGIKSLTSEEKNFLDNFEK